MIFFLPHITSFPLLKVACQVTSVYRKAAAPVWVLLLLLHRKSRCGISALKKEVLFVYINMLEMHTIIIINKNCLPTHG